MSNKNIFNVDDFKRWMKGQQEEIEPIRRKPSQNLVGMTVESKLKLHRLIANMEAEGGNIDELASEFLENGGSVNKVNGKTFLIEVDSGSFFIKRCFVRKKD